LLNQDAFPAPKCAILTLIAVFEVVILSLKPPENVNTS